MYNSGLGKEDIHIHDLLLFRPRGHFGKKTINYNTSSFIPGLALGKKKKDSFIIYTFFNVSYGSSWNKSFSHCMSSLILI